MPQRPHSGVVQPQNSMKESLTDITLRQTIDRMARSCRASNESRSSELLLVLRTLFGAAVLRRTTRGAGTDWECWDGPTWHAAQSNPQLDGYTHTCHEGVPSMELASAGDVEGPSQRLEHRKS